MNTTQTFTAADVAAFAEMIRPHFDRIAGDGMSQADTITAAAMLAKQDEERTESRRYTQIHTLVAALGGTYDEFRAKAVA